MGEGSEAPRIVQFADARRMPWRNGGGETAEVAVHPPGAALDAFGWRVSLARITSDGPFSTFHNVDRTFALLDGGGLVLMVGSGPPTRLGTDAAPLRFAGEAPCRCRLLDGSATALNVMTDRETFACAVARLVPGRGPFRAAGEAAFLVCAEGEIATDLGTLGRLDILAVPAGATVGILRASVPARAVSVSILPVRATLIPP